MTPSREKVPDLFDDVKDIFSEVVNDLPRRIVENLIEKKLTATGQSLSPAAKSALVEHILKDGGENFVWKDADGIDAAQPLSLTFDEEDFAEIDSLQARLPKALAEELFAELDEQSRRIFKTHRTRWKRQAQLQAEETAGFEERLRQRWGKGIEFLQMMITISRETGAELLSRYYADQPTEIDIRFMLLLRLHARACQVMEEIVCLLESGLADGAMARWRTLHELSVVCAVIADGDRDLTERFIRHETIDQWGELKEYEEAHPNQLPSKAESRRRAALRADYDSLTTKYGKPFAGLYGWAAHHLKNNKPTFKDLQAWADKAGERSIYKLASANVHAGARGTLSRLTSMKSARDLIPGRSNAGLDEPGRNSAFSFTQITGTMIGRPQSVADVMAMKSLILMRDAAAKAFDRAGRKLRREEAAKSSRSALESAGAPERI